MSQYTLTLLDATGIQDYIFSSNRLQENIGASEIVYRATTLWAFEELGKAGFKHNVELIKNVENITVSWKFKDGAIEDDPSLQAEVLQAAGGNALILFRENEAEKHANAIKFTKAFTLRIMREAPGLNVLAQHTAFDFDADILPSKYDSQGKVIEGFQGKRRDLEASMSKHKLSHSNPMPFMGLGVTADCSSTGFPAVRTPVGKQKIGENEFTLLIPGQDEKESERARLISRETTFKLAARELANKRLRYILGTVAEWYDFPADIDNLGRVSGEESYVAVIHADGNQMGSKTRAIENSLYGKFDKPDKSGRKIFNREYIKTLREFSDALENACRISLTNVVEKIVSSIKDGMVAGEIPIVNKQSHKYIPFRPLVFGGDDVTFLCNGQLGVELAAMYLDEFKKHTNGYNASAGVSIVKMHYPFARAYKLAEELTASAKTLNRDPKPDCSAIDWHFAQSGLSGSLKVIREREYKVNDGHLEMRPLKMKDDHRSWETVKKVMRTFKQDWSDKHNKVVGLREALRNGGNAVRKYLQDYDLMKIKLPEINGLSIDETGWQGDRCYYFDAVELLDHYVSLENEKVEAKQ